MLTITSDGYQVVNLVDFDSVPPHLLVDAVDVLGSTRYLGSHSGAFQLLLAYRHRGLNSRVALVVALVQKA